MIRRVKRMKDSKPDIVATKTIRNNGVDNFFEKIQISPGWEVDITLKFYDVTKG